MILADNLRKLHGTKGKKGALYATDVNTFTAATFIRNDYKRKLLFNKVLPLVSLYLFNFKVELYNSVKENISTEYFIFC